MRNTFIASLVVLLAVVAQGCGHSKGGPAPVAEANLIIDNSGENHSYTVFIDGSRLATVPAEETESFYVVPGLRRVEVRSGNDLNPVRDLGYIEFPDTSVPGFKPVRL